MIIRSVAIVATVLLATGCSAPESQPAPPPSSQTSSITAPTSTPLGAGVCGKRMDKPLQQELEAAGYFWQSEWDREKLGCVQRWATVDGARYIDLTDPPFATTTAPYDYSIENISMAKPTTIEGRKPFLALWCSASQPHVVRTSLNDFDAAVRAFYETKQLGEPDWNHISQFAGPRGTTAMCFAQEQE